MMYCVCELKLLLFFLAHVRTYIRTYVCMLLLLPFPLPFLLPLPLLPSLLPFLPAPFLLPRPSSPSPSLLPLLLLLLVICSVHMTLHAHLCQRTEHASSDREVNSPLSRWAGAPNSHSLVTSIYCTLPLITTHLCFIFIEALSPEACGIPH